MREFPSNLLRGVGLGIGVATGFTVWITFLRLKVGTKPFDGLDTTYSATVALYYGGGAVGGLLIGALLPLRRWPWGSALLGMLGVFPLYFGVQLTKSHAVDAFTLDNVLTSAFLAFLVGGAVGIWIWMEENPASSGLIGALRRPTTALLGKIWGSALVIALASYIVLPRWSGSWNPTLTLFTAFVLFVIPLTSAVLVTLAWVRGERTRTGT